MWFHDRYGSDVLSGGRTHRRPSLPQVPAQPGLVVEVVDTGFVGAVVRIEKAPGGIAMVLEGRHGARVAFPLGPGYLVEGRQCELTRQAPRAPAASAGGAAPGRTASG